MSNFNQDPWSEGHHDGYVGNSYDNPYRDGTDDYNDYDAGFDAGRAARSAAE